MNKLYLSIEKEWFDKILSGEKKEEYRLIKPYWIRRLGNKKYDAVVFSNGYTHDSPKITIECLGIQIVDKDTPIHNGRQYQIKLGKILGKKNVKG